MLLSVKGTFQNGVVHPAEFVEGRNGQSVVIVFLEEYLTSSATYEEDTAWDTLAHLIEDSAIETGVTDLAHQHDHYLYNKAKKGQDGD